MTSASPARPVLLVTRRLPEAVESRLLRDYDCRLNTADRPMAPEEIIAAAEGADALLVTSSERYTADLIARLPARVKMLATFSVGFEHIDLAAARARGLAVSNTPDVLTDATADIALLLMLGAARGASEGERMVREATWTTTAPTKPLFRDVSGQRLGILGMGRIGQAVARRARAFGMELHYHNRRPLDARLEAELGVHYHAWLEDMLPGIDILSIHCASTPETRGMINAQMIARLPRGAILVNSARGDVVDDDAVIAAVLSGQLGAIGLDVYRGEPAIDPRYRNLPNSFLLPHLGSATHKTRIAMGMRAADNLDAFFRGERPRDLLT